MRQSKQHVAVFLQLLAPFAQLLFRPPEFIVRLLEFDRALDYSFFKQRVKLTDFALCPLALGYVYDHRREKPGAASTGWDEDRTDIGPHDPAIFA